HEAMLGLFFGLVILLAFMDAGWLNIGGVILIGLVAGLLHRWGINYGVLFMILYSAPWLISKLAGSSPCKKDGKMEVYYLNKTSNDVGIGRAYSKLVLIGEHSVVYGKPAIALPFPTIEAKSEVFGMNGPIMMECPCYSGLLSEIPDMLIGISACILETCKVLNKPQEGFLIRISSSI